MNAVLVMELLQTQEELLGGVVVKGTVSKFPSSVIDCISPFMNTGKGINCDA
jgi:hypothetical protein